MSQSITIAFIDASKQRQLYSASSDRTISIGKHLSSNIQQLHPCVGDCHCQVRFSTSLKCWIIEDLGSSKGTYLNGSRISKARALSNNDRIRLGSNGPILSIGLHQVSTASPGKSPHQKTTSNQPAVATLFGNPSEKSYAIPIILCLLLSIGGFAAFAIFKSESTIFAQKKPTNSQFESNSLKTICSVSTFGASELYNIVKESVVLVQTPTGTGSGVVISSSNGLTKILTNYHVVKGHQEATLHFLNHSSSTGVVIKHGSDGYLSDDLALLTTPLNGLNIAKLSTLLSVGDNVFVIGNPSLGEGTGTISGWSLTSGIVSNIDPFEEDGIFQTDAGINPGNSGGPIFNSKGCVVGIAVAVPSDRTVQQVGFAISSTAINRFLAN